MRKTGPSDSVIDVPPEDQRTPLPGGIPENATGGGGSRLSDLNGKLLFKKAELVKLFVQLPWACCLAFLIACWLNWVDEEKLKYHRVWIPVIASLLSVGPIIGLTSIVLHMKNWQRGAAISGLTCIACGVLPVPIFLSLFLPTDWVVGMWAIYAVSCITNGAVLLIPSAGDDPVSQSVSPGTKIAPRKDESKSSSYQSGEIVSNLDAPRNENETLGGQSAEGSSPEELNLGSLSARSLIYRPVNSFNSQLGEITSAEHDETEILNQSIAPVALCRTEILNLQSEDVKLAELTIPEDLDLAAMATPVALCRTEIVKLQSEDVKLMPLVGCFVIGSNPPEWVMRGYLKRVWGKHGIASINVLPNGVFIVEFFDYSKAMEVADNYHTLMFDGKPVFTKLWDPNLIITSHIKEEMIPAGYTVPTWIDFPELDSKYLNPRCLKKLAGEVGKPLKVKINRWFNSGRVLVEVNLNQELPDWVHFEDEEGFMREQKLAYAWRPVLCESCKRFGHTIVDCRKRFAAEKTKRMWVVKATGPVVVAPNIDSS